MLVEYERPQLDETVNETLEAFLAKRKPDMVGAWCLTKRDRLSRPGPVSDCALDLGYLLRSIPEPNLPKLG